MFKINYRIIDEIEHMKTISVEEFEKEYNDFWGDISIEINDYEYGLYLDEALEEDQEGWEALFHWFYGLLGVCVELKKDGYVMIDDIESYNSYIEFKLLGDNVIVSHIISNKLTDGVTSCPNSWLVKEPIKQYEYGDFNNLIITYDELKNEVIRASELFLNEIKSINDALLSVKSVLALINYIDEVKAISQR